MGMSIHRWMDEWFSYRVSRWLANWQLFISLAGISFFCYIHTTHKLLATDISCGCDCCEALKGTFSINELYHAIVVFKYVVGNSTVSSRHSLPSVLTRQRFDEYLRYRNQAIRLATKLWKRYYDTNVQNLCQSDSHNWWRQMKWFTGQTSQSELTGLANNISNGSLHHLAETINLSLRAVLWWSAPK